MVATISEPTLSRVDAAPVIELALRAIHHDVRGQAGPVKRAVLGGLRMWFRHTRDGLSFGVYQSGTRVLAGYLDPAHTSKRSCSNDRFDPHHWMRGQWEQYLGVPIVSYDPHWDDRLPECLKKAIRKAASSPVGSEVAQLVLHLMAQYSDGRFEDLIELTVTGDECAGDYACWVVNAMRGPNMAAMVPLMMWVNGAPSSDVLKAYKEAHDKQGVRRRHVRAVLGSSQRVADFLAFVTGSDQLERVIEFVRAAPAIEVNTLIADLAQRSDPIADEIFPGGVTAFLQPFLTNPSLTVRGVLIRKRSGLFS